MSFLAPLYASSILSLLNSTFFKASVQVAIGGDDVKRQVERAAHALFGSMTQRRDEVIQ